MRCKKSNNELTTKNLKKGKIVHFFYESHFLKEYLLFMKENFDIENHFFIICGPKKNLGFYSSDVISDFSYIYWDRSSISALFIVLKKLQLADLIIYHCYIGKDRLLFFSLLPHKFKRVFWLVWGGDANDDYINKKSFLNRSILLVKKLQIKHIHYISACESDYRAIQKRYHVSPTNMPIYNAYTPASPILSSNSENKNTTINVIVGSDALETNRDEEIIRLLHRFSAKNLHVFIPLPQNKSLADTHEYIEQVTIDAKKYFGEKVTIFSQVIEKREYLSILSRMDIGIYNSSVQQGVGTITTMLRSGAKIYMDTRAPLWKIFTGWGFAIHSVESLKSESFDEFINYDKSEKEWNMKNGENQFGDEMRVKQWGRVFQLAEK